MAIPLTSESAPAALSDGDQMLVVDPRAGGPKLFALVREPDDSAVEGGMVAAGGGRKGKRAEYRCAACGYGIVVYGQAPSCPMCREARWQHVEWRPFSQLLDFALPVGTRSHRGRLNAPSLATGRGADPLPFHASRPRRDPQGEVRGACETSPSHPAPTCRMKSSRRRPRSSAPIFEAIPNSAWRRREAMAAR